MTGRGFWASSKKLVLVPVALPGVPLPLCLPWTRSHSKWCPFYGPGLAWPVSAAPAGGEGQNLQQQQQLGLWVIAGFLTFLALEKMFLDSKEQEGANQVSPTLQDLDTLAPFYGGARAWRLGSELNPEKEGLLAFSWNLWEAGPACWGGSGE